jgi:RNA polymerase sigma-70 factor (ECF subfamily)
MHRTRTPRIPRRKFFRCQRLRRFFTLDAMQPTNTSLIRRVRNLEDARSWSEFVELYEPLLLSYVRSRSVDVNDARDVVQLIFIKLLRALPNMDFDPQRARFRTWLWQVTMNALSDHFRQQKSRGKAEQGWRDVSGATGAVEDSGEPDKQWVDAHRQRVLEFVLPKVQAKTQAKSWHCFEQFILRRRTCKEIAPEVELTPNAVCVNANRVLERVRALCADYMEELDDENASVS